MTALSLAYPRQNNGTFAGEASAPAGLICLFGVFLYIILSTPLLNALGMPYAGDEGSFYQKIHPGTVFIYLSFFVLLSARRDPIRQFLTICSELPAFAFLLGVYLLLFAYMLARSGSAGLAFIIDTHMTVPLAAIVLCYTPVRLCRRAAYAFVVIAAINSLIGIVEAAGRFHLFAFDPEWDVLKEDYFRATALRGHPLTNAMFTMVALFVTLALRYPLFVKALLAPLFLASLFAFGGRAALAISVLGLFILGLHSLKGFFFRGPASLLQAFLAGAAVIAVPLCVVAGLYLLAGSSLGERITAREDLDSSAASRQVAVKAFDYMTREEVFFGVTNDRTTDISQRMNTYSGLADIENPWFLMFMQLGAIAFALWLAALSAFVWKLVKDQPLALQWAVIGYFIAASTSNSFGRKDSTCLIVAAAVISAARALARRV